MNRRTIQMSENLMDAGFSVEEIRSDWIRYLDLDRGVEVVSTYETDDRHGFWHSSITRYLGREEE